MRPSSLIFLIFALLYTTTGFATASLKHSVRLDPGRLYELYDFSKQDISVVAESVAEDISNAGFSRVFVFAYSPVYGAFFRTKYPQTEVENFLGQGDFAKLFVQAARRKSLDVVFSLPINNYETPWTQNPNWRVKNDRMQFYKPDTQSFFLSASSVGYQKWFLGFVDSILRDFPEIQGLEALEPNVDLLWAQETDFNEHALKRFAAQYPSAMPRSQEWWTFRSQEMTRFLAAFFKQIHGRQKESHLVQTWPANSDGQLITAKNLSDLIGLDFKALRDLPQGEKPHFFQVQLLWQQWKSQFGTLVFDPKWVRVATPKVIEFFKGSSETSTKIILHIEKSEFKGPSGVIKPSKNQFMSNLKHSLEAKLPIDVYDYTQLKQSGLLNDLRPLLK